ncbi:LysR family transcriptional regulator [Roseovarius sp. 2305UL8-3]|uniref:LysR family transcriptional regulator n=1 Tax=Roseovarius conchicola TaxID=3121636 RepID=UPI003528F4DF
MKLEWIEDILAVLESGSFTAAAERRYLTPSAFTRRIRAMESALGCDLFDRSRKPITLLPHVQNMEVELRDAARRFRELRLRLSDAEGHNRNRLRLCCQHALTTTVAPSLLRDLGQERQTELRIRSGTRSDCHLMLLRQEVDFGLIYETPQDALQFDSSLFEKIGFGTDRLIPVANIRDAPHLFDALKAGELPLISYPANIYLGEVLRVHILPHLPRGIVTHSLAETGLTPAVLQFLRQGLGIGWLPHSMAREALERGELSDLSGDLPWATLDIRVIRARGGGKDAAFAAWDILQSQSAGPIP